MLISFTPKRFHDERGWFTETFNARKLSAFVPQLNWVQDNQSSSKHAGTVRGLHFQAPPHAQAKLVSCLRGAIFDVVVDIRKNSPSYGQHISVELSAENGRHLYVPIGFAHGLMTLEPDTQVSYKVSDYYAPECEGGILWNDKELDIPWPIRAQETPLSPKDGVLPLLKDFVSPFTYDGVPMSLIEAP
jgi:dTDP-4-dehydrorhamnose 3,5-epimerase